MTKINTTPLPTAGMTVFNRHADPPSMSRLAMPTGKNFYLLTSWTHYTKSGSKSQVFDTQNYIFYRLNTQIDGFNAGRRVKYVLAGFLVRGQSLIIGLFPPVVRQFFAFAPVCRVFNRDTGQKNKINFFLRGDK